MLPGLVLSPAGQWTIAGVQEEVNPHEILLVAGHLGFEAFNEEIALLVSLFKESEKEYAAHPEDAKKLLEVGLASSDESLDPLKLASWTMVSRALLNLGETTIRN